MSPLTLVITSISSCLNNFLKIAERIAIGKQLTVNGKPIIHWLHNCSPFTIYRLRLF